MRRRSTKVWFAVMAYGVFVVPTLASVGNVTGVARNGDTLVVSAGVDTVVVQVCRANLLRVDYRPSGKASANTLMIATTNWLAADATINTNGDPILIDTTNLHVELARAPFRIAVYDATGTNLLLREQAAEGLFADGVRFHHRPGSDFYGIGGYNAWDDSSAGMLRNSGGWVEAGYQGDCGAPLAWTRQGFGVLVDSDGGQFSISGTNTVFEYCSKTNILLYIAAGPPADILAAAAEVTGKAPLFPKYAMGFANTEWDITQSELTNIVNGYRSRAIPIDHYIVDFDWKAWSEDNYGEWRWNTTKFPGGPSGTLQAQMRAAGMHLSGIMKPRIFVYTVQGNYATANGFWWPGSSEYQDYFTGGWVNDLNYALSACRDWYWDHITNAFSTGITGWWNDEADQKGGGGGFFDNWEFMNMQRSLYEGQRGYSTQRVWSINRNFHLGAQRYAYAMWSGDIDTGFSAMAAQRERMLSALNLGQAWWGMDIGGFNGGDPSPENYARWIQFGAFVPVFRVHGQQYAQRQPWIYGSTAETAAVKAIRLRYQLLPYIYSGARRVTETGAGFVRPLFHDFPGDPNAANYKEAWMFGDALLAAPVVAQGQTAKSIYLPAGTWFDYFRGTRYAGGQTLSYAVNSTTWTDIPLFVRQGAILPSQPAMNYADEFPLTNVTVDIFPDPTASAFTYYDDDGMSYAYETGRLFRQEFTAQDHGESISVDISAATGSFVPPLQTYFCRLYCPTASAVTINGTAATSYASIAALEAAAGEGWALGTNRFGPLVAVKVAAGAAKSIVASNNAVATPVFAPPGGTFTGAVLVAISCATEGAAVRFTTDGSEPDETDPLYAEPLLLAVSTTVKARGFKDGRTPSVVAEAPFVRDDNLLRNAGFELQGSSTNNALYWIPGEPDLHGETWGSGLRVSWRSHSDTWQGTVRGTWAGAGSEGGFWQEAPAAPGRAYRFSAWLWADSDWAPSLQAMKIEFFSGASMGETMLVAHTNTFTGVGPTWTNRAMQATAPTNADWVRVVIVASGVSGSGALQFDDLRLDPTNVYTLTVESPHGSPSPAIGVHLVDLGRTLTNSVNSPVTSGETQYVCAGWTLAGHAPTSGAGAVMTMTVTNNAVLTWRWTTNFLNPSFLAFSSTTYTSAEADVIAHLTVLRSGGSNGEVSVSYRTADGSAADGRDYAAVTGTLVLADGVVTGSVAVELFHDLQFEPDETIAMSLFSPAGATLAAPTGAVLTILDDDADLGTRTLDVSSAHGQPDPPAGLQAFDYGIRLTAAVTGTVTESATQYVCAGWAGTGSVPASGATNATPAFLLTNDSGLAWQWITNVYFSPAAGPNGSVAGDPAGWYPLGAGVAVTATPVSAYSFAAWTGDVPSGHELDNPLSLTLDQARAVTATFAADAGENLLNNPGFEQAGTASVRALYWDQGDPDTHGEMWGTAARVDWRSHGGAWEGAIQGQYSGAGTEGGFWQEVAASPGEEYRLSGWFWADDGNPYGPWGAGEQAIKLEFFESGVLLHAATGTLAGVGQVWEERSVSAIAPTNADWVRAVILARDISYDGSLQLDDLVLKIVPTLDPPSIQQAVPLDDTSCTLEWSAVAEASGYLLDVATNAGFQPGTRAADLFISEYGNATSNDRYIEIWNGTGAEVDLAGYRVWGIRNGGNWYESSLVLSNTLANGAVHVVVNSSATSAVLRAAADQFAANTAPMNFTGDDAVGLAKVIGVVTTLVDAVGAAGSDPGTGWGVAGVADATFDHVLVRKSAVTAGNTDWSTCTNEWTVLPVNTWTNVGQHRMDVTPGDFVPGFEDRAAPGVTSLTVTGLAAGVTYYFRVRATNAESFSVWSDTFEASLASEYGILATAGEHGSVAPSGLVMVAAGAGTNFVVQADPYYEIVAILTNGVALSLPPGLTTYTAEWSQVSATGTFHSTFAERLAEAHATPWWWLAARGLTNAETSFNEAELGDTDTDGHPAWSEYVADTDPGDPQSVLKATPGGAASGDAYTIRWPGSTGRYYHVYRGTNLAIPFDRVASNLPGVAPVTVHTDAVSQGQNPAFYRVRALLAPEE